ncbi:MAG: folylpolyglutamate synthase/dihydrofolate synthase family protein [Alphaproteobacteria bacterium]
MLKRLAALHPRTIDLSLGRIERLLAALGHPERSLPPVVHVAGTNGKGSVVAYLRAMVEAAGLRAHVYTSPHLVRFHERIRVAGRLIGERALADVLRTCEEANAGAPITFFEITTAAAFLAFSRTPADVTLLEVGLGGRLDATNVVARPAVTVITPVSLDHQHFLGNTLAAIATEKAGILKPGVPAVIGPQHAVAARAIAKAAHKVRAPLTRYGKDFQSRKLGDGGFAVSMAGERTTWPVPGLSGEHQYANAALALIAARALNDSRLTPEALTRGIAEAQWPARLQRLGNGRRSRPLARLGFEVWLDGGHNPHAGRALAHTLAQWREAAPRNPVYLICGMVQGKNPRGFLTPLARHAAAVWTVPVPEEHAGIAATELARIARALGLSATAKDSVTEALEAVARRRPGRLLIAGSLYLAGALLAAEGPAARIR